MIGLPLALRLRRAFLVALVIGLWAPGKIIWENSIAREQLRLRYHGITITPSLRDKLGQGLTIGVMSGMGSAVADLLWLNVTSDWERKRWFEIESYINLCTALQPRTMVFWSIGGWQLAWNASVDAMRDKSVHSDLQRLKASRFWIQRGLDVYLRGIRNNPERYRLFADTGLLYQMRKADQEERMGLKVAAAADYRQAAYYYAEALQRPDCPQFYERFPAYMLEKAGDDRAAYDYWRQLWYRLTPAEKLQPQHAAGKVESSIRNLEKKLNIPPEKRVFPN